MPFPLGHAAIGLATYEVCATKSAGLRWRYLAAIAVLANLPDIDILFGLLLKVNGFAYHRGPTHSMLFAVLMGFCIAQMCRRWSVMPQLNFYQCTLLILSHVVSDAWLTTSPVSFFWPFEVYWSAGNGGWTDVVHSVVTDSDRDIGIVAVCILFMVLYRLSRTHWVQLRLVARHRNWPAGFFG